MRNDSLWYVYQYSNRAKVFRKEYWLMEIVWNINYFLACFKYFTSLVSKLLWKTCLIWNSNISLYTTY